MIFYGIGNDTVVHNSLSTIMEYKKINKKN